MVICDTIPLSEAEYFDLYNEIQSVSDEGLRERLMRLYNTPRSRLLQEALNTKQQTIRELKETIRKTQRELANAQRQVEQYQKDFGEIDSETKQTANRILELLEKRDRDRSIWNRIKNYLDIRPVK